jgi:hypothetical protein
LALLSLGFPRVMENIEGYSPAQMLDKVREDASSGVRLAPWRYCTRASDDGLSGAVDDVVTTLPEFKRLVGGSKDCDTVLARHVIFDVLKTEKVVSGFWNNAGKNGLDAEDEEEEEDDGVGPGPRRRLPSMSDGDAIGLRFIATTGGVTRFAPARFVLRYIVGFFFFPRNLFFGT